MGLRLLGAVLTLLWTAAAVLVLVGYHPGGPADLLVGLTAALAVPVAATALAWPPVVRGSHLQAATGWLAIGAILLLVPSIGGLVAQLLARGPQTLLPSLEAAYPWLLALGATALYAGIGVARHRPGVSADRRARIRLAGGFAGLATVVVAAAFASAAIANELALTDRPTAGSRYGPTDPALESPSCDAPVMPGPVASVAMTLDGVVDRRPLGSVRITGARQGLDFRWNADVVTDRVLGLYGAARRDGERWTLEPRRGWRTSTLSLDGLDLDLQVVRVALGDGERVAAENLGVAIVEGARARHCRVALDGPTFRAAFPAIGWFVEDDASFERWRGELDYWVFLDGQLGRVSGSMNGPAAPIGLDGIQGTIRVTMNAVDRDARITIIAPR